MVVPVLRFAPSPTGYLHLGGLRTALFNYLTAKKLDGKLILRIEDTDQTRLVKGSVENIRSSLEWAGISYDYGPGKGGPHGPYFQSERLDLYHSHTHKLLESRKAYRCFCDPNKLQATREKLKHIGSNATYDRACLKLTDEEVARRVRAGEKHVIRLYDESVPKSKDSQPRDIVFGDLRVDHSSLPTDPVLLKSDKFPTYHLANVVDDHEMEVTHVVRGEEWLQSLPLHLALYKALEFAPPQFAHLPLLLNPDKSKMSKRSGDVAVEDYIKKGWEPEAVINWLALGGWSISRDPHDTDKSKAKGVFTLPQLIDMFDLQQLTHRRTVLDPGLLLNLNKHHLSRKLADNTDSNGLEDLVIRAKPILQNLYPGSPYLSNDAYIEQVLKAVLGRCSTFNDLADPEVTSIFFVEPDYNTPVAEALLKSLTPHQCSQVIEELIELIPSSSFLGSLSEQRARENLDKVRGSDSAASLSSKEFMNILRHALTGRKVGPSVAEIISILGVQRVIARLASALMFHQGTNE
ncbi:Glutamate--tRNA ligase mitochondrial [Tulasnella sp. 418]|nr:Glutamate--tRNA ligase mitochondrial [Tulasnella sp. 418]